MRTRVQHQDYPFLIVQIVEFHGNGPIFRCRGRCCRAASRSRARHIRLRHQRRERNLKATIVRKLQSSCCHETIVTSGADGTAMEISSFIQSSSSAILGQQQMHSVTSRSPFFSLRAWHKCLHLHCLLLHCKRGACRGRQGCKAMAGRRWG